MFEYRTVIVATLAAQIAGVTLFSAVLLALWRRYRRQHLALWSASFAALLLFSCGKLASLWGVSAASPARVAAQAATMLGGIAQPVLLYLGALVLGRDRRLDARTRARVLAALVAAAAAGTAAARAASPEWRLPLRVGLVALVSTAGLVAAAVQIRHGRPGAQTGKRLVLVGFFAYAASQAAYLAACLPLEVGHLASWMWLAGFGDVVFQAVLGLGLVVWHLEEEHARAQCAWESARRRAQALERARHLESVGQLAGQIAHDYGNQVTALLGHSALARAEAGGNARVESALDRMEEVIAQASSLTRQLLAIGRMDEVRPERLSLDSELERRRPELERLLGAGVRLEIDTDHRAPEVEIDRAHLERILWNLALNARDALEGTGRLRIAVECVSLDSARAASLDLLPGEHARWTFDDDGPGFAPRAREHLFEPFFTTKGPERGSGLGLASVRGCVRSAHGAVAILTPPWGRGARVEIHLPAAPARPRSKTPPGTAAGAAPAAPHPAAGELRPSS